ncbi:MAG TPA: hypothetical protein VHZ52_18870 [Acidobacteriaceae bacterium]|jgi:hypothetical protein|nr:hypothetical protein [Acidobacteriaceae bacterium]
MQINSTPPIATGAAQAQSNADLLVQSTIYTANVGGKNYVANLNLSEGEYVASIPNHIPSINASGSNLVLAENNLNARISLLV